MYPQKSVKARPRTINRIRLLEVAVLIAFTLDRSNIVLGQGCIASRGSGMSSCELGGLVTDEGQLPPTSGFQGAVSYRWLHSDRMFVHDVEQTQREDEGSQEINDQHFFDIGISYAFTPRFSTTLTIPFAINDRSQVVRAVNVERTIIDRFHTHSAGLGDIRLEGNAWILDPHQHMTGNALVGLGFSAPSGDRDVQDTFQIPHGTTPISQVHAVDQSIQLGSGGWGMIFDLFAFRQIVHRLDAYINGQYTMTPQEKYTPTASLVGDYSITDNYMARGGFDYLLWPKYSLSLNLGARIDGVPVHDLVGGSEGFRRPGYAISIEPGLNLMVKSWNFSLNTPVAVYRNRQQSVPERDAGIEPVAAGFADFLVLFSVAKRF
jgi:hypothetical protein